MNINCPKTRLERIGWWVKWKLAWPIWSRITCWGGHDWGSEDESPKGFCNRCDLEYPGMIQSVADNQRRG